MKLVALIRNVFLLWATIVIFLLGEPVFCFAQNLSKNYAVGAYIIDMGQSPQTIANGLKPYGLVYALIKAGIPVDWAINSTKAKDGIDFTANGTNYSGGSFIIAFENRTAVVDALITTWKGNGVKVDGPIPVNFTAPVYKTLTIWPKAYIDDKNDPLVTPYYTNAGILSTSGAYVTNANPSMLPYCGYIDGMAHDVYVMPHANPDDWINPNWIVFLQNWVIGGGSLWAGCQAGSNIENGAGCQFLSLGGLLPESHANGSPPYTYTSAGDPVMQILQILDDATNNGSENIYVPSPSGWRPSTTIAVYQENYINAGITYPKTAGVVVYGPAFGDVSNGFVMYEAGHKLNDHGTIPEQVAAQRAYFNFLLIAGGRSQTKVTPPDVSNQTVPTCSGVAFNVIPSGVASETLYTWTAPTGTGFTGGAAQTTGQSSITGTLTNTTTSPVVATYIVIPKNGGCEGPAFTVAVTVNQSPTIIVTPTSAAICLGSNTTLTASGAVTYTWFPAMGLSSTTGATVTANPTTTTTYTVTGTDANGCSRTTNVTVTVNTSSVTIGATPNPVCVGSTLNLTSSNTFISGVLLSENFNGFTNSWTKINNSTGGTPVNAAWTLRPDGFIANCSGDNKTLHSNDNSQFYQSFSCLQGSGTTATILQSPVMSTIGYNTLTLDFYHFFYFYTGAIASVRVSTDGTNWTPIVTYSTINQGSASAFAHPIINLNSYIGNATFYIQFKYDAPWSWYWAIDNVTVSGTISSPISWTGPNGFTSASQNPSISNITTANAGVYKVTYTDPVTTCTSSNSVTVNVNALPTISLTPASPAICIGNSTVLTASGAVTYNWTPATGLSSTTGQTVTANPLTTTTYTVTGTDANGCSNTAIVEVAVNSLPTISITPASATICKGSSTSLTASGAATYSWSPSTGLSATTGVTVTASPIASTTYTVTGTNANGCANTETVTVTVIPAPVTTGVTICSGGTGSLTSSSICPPGSSITVGPSNAGAGVGTAAVGGTVNWKTPGNAISSGGGNATVDLNGLGVKTSQYLTTTNYNFNIIPINATIVGITVIIGRFENDVKAGNDVKDVGVYLLKAGAIAGDNYADISTEWPKTLTAATYGGTSDLWGTTWTLAEIQSPSFGVSLNVNSDNDRTASVDYIIISVTYAMPGILNWYTASSGGILLGSGSSFNPVGVANSGLPNTNIPGIYTFYAECSSDNRCRTATNFTINPTPAITAMTSNVCSGGAFTVTPVNGTNGVVPSGTTYTWGAPVVTGSLTGGSASSGSTTSITGTLTNPTNTTQTATYTVTPTSGAPALCAGSAFAVTVTVNPTPALSGTLNPSTICSNSLFSFTPSSGTSGTTFSWNRATITGITPVGPTTGTGSINETLVNSTNNPVVVTYAYSLAANSCSNTQNVSVVVIPPANVIASTLPATICLGASTSLTSSSNFLTLPTTILNQNFNSSPAEWTSSNLSLGNNPTLSSWSLQPNGYSYTDEVPTTVTFHSNDNTQFYLSNSRAQGPQVGPPNPYTDTYLTSPMVNISGYSSLTLDFYHCFTYATTNEGTGSLEISTNGKDWNVIETYSSSQGTSGSFAHRTISLSSYIGNQILQIRFHYNTPARARQWAIDNLSLTGTPPQPTISWTSIPSGFSSANANPGTVNPAVTTVYTATYTDPSTNCSGSDTAKVIVNPLPVPTITGPASACLNSAGNVYTTESGKTNYSWTVNGGTITAGGGSANNSVTVTWNNSGTNSLSVNYTDSNGCTATSPTTFAVTVNGLPTITTAANAPGVCFGNGIQTTSLIYSATTGSPTTYSINWNTSPLNSFATVNDVTLTSSPLIITVPANTAAGTYTGTITVKNANGCVSLGNTFSINVNPLPVITVQPADQLDCEGLIVSFHVVATGSGLTYTWQRKKPSGTFTDIPVEPNVTYPSQGTIRLENVGNSDAPDGTQYRVIITNSDNCSITSSIATLYVNEITGINPISTNVTICQGQNYSYQVTTNHPSNVVSYQWKKWNNPGQWDYVIDGGPISGSTTDHLVFTGATPSESGKYKVTVVFHSSGADCNVTSDTRDRTLNVNPTPSCSITGSGSVYAGSTGNIFTSSPNPSDNVIHLWSISGNGTISGSKTGSTVNVDATTVGSFMLTDNISRYGCTSSCTYDVSVIDLPCSITPTTSVTNGTSTTYIAPAGMDSYAWSIAGNGSIPSAIKNQQTITVLAGNSCNTYTLTVTITKSGASSTCTQTIVVTDNIPPTFTLPNTFSECVENLYAATYYGATMDINPDRPEYYTFSHGDPRLDLNTSNLTDNCNLMNCLPVQIHWQIVFSPTPDPLPPHNPVTKSPVTGTGQPSEIVGSIQFPGDGVTFNNTVHTITYWIKDCAGNESLPQSQTITIRPRPNIIKGN